MKPDLLPCPFCGGEARAEIDRMQGHMPIYVRCLACAALGPQHRTEPLAIKAWNTRELLPCPFCGSEDIGLKHDSGGSWVSCPCDAEGPIRDTPHTAALAWSTRA